MARKWMLALVSVIALLVSTVGVVAAQTPQDEGPDDALARMAEELGMTRETLLEALLEGQSLQDVAESQGVDPRRWFQARWMPRPVPLRVPPLEGMPMDAVVEVLAEAVDMEPAELREALAEGTTIPQLLVERNLDPETVAAEVKAATIERIRDAVEEGNLGEARADRMIERLEASDVLERWLSGERPLSPEDVPMDVKLEVVAEALGMTAEDLREALREGQTVPELVDEVGLDPDVLAADIKAEMIARIQKAVEEGELDEDRAELTIERLEASDAIERWLSGEAPRRPSPRQLLQLGKRTVRLLREHPRLRRFFRRRVP